MSLSKILFSRFLLALSHDNHFWVIFIFGKKTILSPTFSISKIVLGCSWSNKKITKIFISSNFFHFGEAIGDAPMVLVSMVFNILIIGNVWIRSSQQPSWCQWTSAYDPHEGLWTTRVFLNFSFFEVFLWTYSVCVCKYFLSFFK